MKPTGCVAAYLLVLLLSTETRAADFADPGLTAAVRQALGQPAGALDQTALLSLTQLEARGRGIADLAGIEVLANLQVLDLADNQVQDLSPLAGLSRLQWLDLEHNEVADLGPLAALSELQSLVLNYNQIEDLSPLAGLARLSSVEVVGNPLGASALAQDIPALQARGVEVLFEAPQGTEEPAPPAEVWEHLGPREEQGQALGVNALAVAPAAPEVVYALTEAGLWRSPDGGQTWAETGLINAEAVVLVDAADPALVYVTSARVDIASENLKSRDGGKTWEVMEVPGRLLAADPVRPGRLYAVYVVFTSATSATTLSLSDDGGGTWRQIGRLESFVMGEFVQVHPADPRIVYAGGTRYDDQGYPVLAAFRSTDGGATWQPYETSSRMAMIAPDPRHPDWLYGVDRNGAWHSQDQGRTWEARGRIPVVGLNRLVVHPAEPGWLWTWSESGAVYQSVDSGYTWKRIASTQARVVPHPRDPARAFLFEVEYGRGNLYETRNHGYDWQKLNLEKTWMPVLALGFDGAGLLYAASWRRLGPSTAAVLLSSADRGEQWLELSARVPEGGWIEMLHINPRHPRLLLVYDPLHGLLRSEDSGATWEVVRLGEHPDAATGVDPEVAADAQGGPTYYALDPGDAALYRSADFGATWEKCRDEASALALSPADARKVYVWDWRRPGVWRSTDGGDTWENLGQVAPGEGVVRLAIHPLEPGRLYAATANGLYASADEGQTWSPLLRSEATWQNGVKIRFDPGNPRGVCLSTGDQVWESADQGQTWVSLVQEPGSPFWIDDVAIDPQAPQWLYAATPWGVYRRLRPAPVTAVLEETQTRPQGFALAQNYPNPFNAQTTIRYQVPQTGPVELVVYDLLGQPVRYLEQGVVPAGEHRVVWDGRDDRGQAVGSGVYLYRLKVGGSQQARRLVVLK